jgi:cellulose 1,4-beta-cellobiosidase
VPNPFSSQAVPGSGLTITPGSINDYLLRAPIAGTYSFTLFGSAVSGAQVAVHIDDQLISTITLPASPGSSTPVSVTLTAGFHGLLLTGTGSGNSTLPGGSVITVALTSASGKGVVPSAPMNLTGTIGSGTATLLWATESTATSYNVYRSTLSGSGYQKIANTTANTYTDSTATNGVTYYYVITAHNSLGQSAVSMQIPLTPTTTGAPATPTGVTLDITGGDSTPFFGGGSAIISWEPVPDAVTYSVQRSTTSGGPYTSVTSQIGLSYNDLTVVDNTTYYYVVTAVNSYGSSAPSTQVSGTTTEVVPTAPTGLTASVPAAGQVFLKWTPKATTTPEFEAAFNVQRSTTSGGPYTTVDSLNTYNYVDLTVTHGATYYYVVSQDNAAGTSANSAQVSVTP